MEDLSRRAFLKLAAAGAATAAGTTAYGIKMADRLVPYVVPPAEARPGSWTAYATTCRECPAGCAMLVRHRDGRATKAEGNPDHPVSRGGLCPRGQSAVQGLYDPDRVRSPHRGPGVSREATWDEAIQAVGDRLRSGGRAFVLSDLQTGVLAGLMDRFARAFGGGLLLYEPLAPVPLRAAHAAVLGRDAVPRYDLSGCAVVLSFGADFLESWVSNVEHARQFADGRVPAGQAAGRPRSRFAYVGPRLSMTAGNADDFLLVPPGTEGRVAMAMLGVMLDRGLVRGDAGRIAALVRGYDFRAPIPGLDQAGVALLTDLAVAFGSAARSGRVVALAGPSGARGPAAEGAATAAALLNLAAGQVGPGLPVDPDRPHALTGAAGPDQAREFLAGLTGNDILLVHNANPAYTLPDWPPRPGGQAPQGRPGLLVHLGTMPDETAALADWVLPVDSPLESWGEYAPYPDVRNLLQPTMARLHDTRNPGDILLALAAAGGRPLVQPGPDGRAPAFVDLLARSWVQAWTQGAPGGAPAPGSPAGGPATSPASSPDAFWHESVRRGGLWAAARGSAAPSSAGAPGAPGAQGAPGRPPAPPARPDMSGQGEAGAVPPGPGQSGPGQSGTGQPGQASPGQAPAGPGQSGQSPPGSGQPGPGPSGPSGPTGPTGPTGPSSPVQPLSGQPDAGRPAILHLSEVAAVATVAPVAAAADAPGFSGQGASGQGWSGQGPFGQDAAGQAAGRSPGYEAGQGQTSGQSAGPGFGASAEAPAGQATQPGRIVLPGMEPAVRGSGPAGSAAPAAPQASQSQAGPTVPPGPTVPASPAPARGQAGQALALWVWPPVGLYDGRHANRNWLQELPEPVSWRTWGTWLDLHPDTARGLGLEDGDWAALATMAGEIEAPVRVTPEVAPDTVAVPLGQGHTSLGRNAVPRGANGFRLLAGPAVTASSAGPFGQAALRKAKRPATQVHPPVTVTSSQDQHDRELLRWTTPAGGRNSHAPEHFSLPLPEGYDPARDVYPGHKHAGHRWAMVVDLARCIGCGACSVACQAENNIPSIGPVELGRHRNLSWLRVVPYRHPDDPRRVGWLPLMCQHCDAAPCEPVCPVYASMHNEEGLNAQIYNRCVGTRYCNNNCPYKVRRFNWFDYSETAFVPPLDWQLNPDVTVRRRGVMEKCTFCVQRIREAEYRARIEGNRMLRDGEVQPACVQSCPARVFAFGDLHDPASEVSRLFRTDPRRYQLLGELNTKPGVAYLRRLDRG